MKRIIYMTLATAFILLITLTSPTQISVCSQGSFTSPDTNAQYTTFKDADGSLYCIEGTYPAGKQFTMTIHNDTIIGIKAG